MLDHVGFGVSDYARSKEFYEQALSPLGLEVLMEPMDEVCGFGSQEDQKPFFWLTGNRDTVTSLHVAFEVDNREKVDAFHQAALAAGGTDNGGPGVREIYHPNYYGAFVLDPDGNNAEAVCHLPA